MRKRVIDLRTERPLLDIASLGRRGPEAKLTPNEVASIARTARRVPEVVIKVSGGARTLHGVGAHFEYKGLNEIETDMGERLMERGFEKDLMLDWDLDLVIRRRHTGSSHRARTQAAQAMISLRSSAVASCTATGAPSRSSSSDDSSYQTSGARVPQNERQRGSLALQRNGSWSGSPV